MNYDFAFWTPGRAPAGDGSIFGCAAHGLAAPGQWIAPTLPASTVWPTRLNGETLSGTYADVLAQLERRTRKPTAAVVLFAHGSGMEAFLEGWAARLPGVPVVGGAAARGAGQQRGELRPESADVAVLLIAGGTWRAETLNAHDATAETFAVKPGDPRLLAELRRLPDGAWEPAGAFYRARQRAHGVPESDCEAITFSDTDGRNIHCGLCGSELRSGANLPVDRRLALRTVSRADAAARLAAFCAVPNALVFSCAGLRGLLDAPLTVAPGTLVGFMFGELVTVADRPQFGNLMAARLLSVSSR